MKRQSLLDKALEERSEVEAELASHPLQKRLVILTDIIAKLGGEVTQKGSSKKDIIHQLAKKCIAEQGGYAKLAAIYDYVVRHGVKVSSGTTKAYLYDFTDLKSSRKKGWSVK